MKVNRNIIEIDEELCNGCGECVVNCAEAALKIVDGKARLVAEVYCDGLGACLGHCPQGALRVVERPADEFDESAVEELLKQQGRAGHSAPQAGQSAPRACPSSRIQMHTGGGSPCDTANRPSAFAGSSALSHWPVQIKLVPPTAPFLNGADLLIAADCVPVAYPGFHSDLLTGKAVIIGCPKFDNGNEYFERFKAMFRQAGLKSVTVAIMEVPCCQGLNVMVKKALDESGMQIPLKTIVVGTRGNIVAER